MTVVRKREQSASPWAFQSISHYSPMRRPRSKAARPWSTKPPGSDPWAGDRAQRPVGEALHVPRLPRHHRNRQQVWGGVGFTIEYDIQLYFRRAKQLQMSWYDDRHLGELVAAQELDSGAAS